MGHRFRQRPWEHLATAPSLRVCPPLPSDGKERGTEQLTHTSPDDVPGPMPSTSCIILLNSHHNPGRKVLFCYYFYLTDGQRDCVT